MLRSVLMGILIALGLTQGVHAEQVYATCDEFKRGYEVLSSRPFSFDAESLTIAIETIADNHLRHSDKTMTAFATREQLAKYLSGLKEIDALIWLQETYTGIETQLKICAGAAFEQKRIELRVRPVVVDPKAKSCGVEMGKSPDLSQPLKK